MDDAGIAALPAMLSGRRAAGFIGVWPDNRPAVDAFLAAASQWRTAMALEGGRLRTLWIGLDYAGAAAAWSLCGLAVSATTFASIQALEVTARSCLNGEA